MPLIKLQFAPGIKREATNYANEGGWWDCDKVRFRQGYPEKIGGWAKFDQSSLLGTTRAIHPWISLDANEYIGFGTNLKYYVFGSGQFNDITPIRETTAAGDVTFAATNGSSILTVNDTGHGALLNDFVTFSGAVSLGGNVTDTVLNAEHEITRIVDTNSYEITLSVSANASDSGNGGGAVVGEYQINTGLDTSVFGSGWGAGPWSRGGWGSGTDVVVAGAQLRIWTHDNYGGDLIINVRDGGIYYWEREPSFARAEAIYTMTGAQSAPRLAKQVLVSDNDRHVIAFGCDDEFTPGVIDPLLIRFSSQENFLEWRSLPTTTAGSIRVGSGSTIICAVETKQQVLVFTDVSLHGMQYLGPPFTFGLSMLSDNISIASPNAAIGADDAVYWMGQGDFYTYNGVVSQLPCDVRDYVFSDINTDQFEKVCAGVNPAYGEVWWFYPSASSQENNKYVVYNYQQKIWYYGSMARTAWTHRNQGVYPIACGDDNYVYTQEFGADDGSVFPEAPISAYIESSGQDIGEGDQFSFMWRMIPDITFRTSTGSPSATFTIKASNFPGTDFSQSDPRVVYKTASVPVEQFTDQLYVRVRGRSFAFRVSSDTTGVLWRLGAPRVDIRTDGKR